VKRVLSLGVFSASGRGLEDALVALGMPAGEDVVHEFEPIGISWVRFSEMGRVALHTWPEQGLVSVDVWAEEPMDLVGRLATLGWTPVEQTDRAPQAEAGL
jgi:hypothetical protein